MNWRDIAAVKQLIEGGTTTPNVVGLEVAGTAVVGAQGGAVADATDAASVILRLNELLAILRTHGLIET